MAFPNIEPGGSLVVAWQLRHKHVLLVGGGDVAAGRLVSLKNADAHVTVVAPRAGLCEEMQFRIDTEGTVDEYCDVAFTDSAQLRRTDGGDYDMVFTAIDDAALSRQICAWCRERRIPVNVADVPPECDFYFGSVLRRGPLQVLVSTGGKGPRLARKLRLRIGDALPDSVGDALVRVGALRVALRRVAPDAAQGPRRMQWMTDVCELWPLEKLGSLDDAAIARMLAIGWAQSRVPAPTEVGIVDRTEVPDTDDPHAPRAPPAAGGGPARSRRTDAPSLRVTARDIGAAALGATAALAVVLLRARGARK
ncbi:Bifunctional dehydrogenase and ferrochelatase [Malassezia sp. CBS 17886]|nr:Bifunctional dehydrogenase and ferrochelatase [Malassezia sp. CBS 17886]